MLIYYNEIILVANGLRPIRKIAVLQMNVLLIIVIW